MKLLEGLIGSIKNSADPLSTGASYLISYLYLEKVQLSSIVEWVNNLNGDVVFDMIVVAGFLLIGHNSFKPPEQVKLSYLTPDDIQP